MTALEKADYFGLFVFKFLKNLENYFGINI